MSKLLKAFCCAICALAIVGLTYFSFEIVVRDDVAASGKVFSALFGLAVSFFLVLLLIGLVRTSYAELRSHAKVLARIGIRRAQQIDPAEFDRLASTERSVDAEIAERLKDRTNRKARR